MRTYYAVRFALKVSKAHNSAYHSPTKIGHAYQKPNLKTLCRYTPCRLTAVLSVALTAADICRPLRPALFLKIVLNTPRLCGILCRAFG